MPTPRGKNRQRTIKGQPVNHMEWSKEVMRIVKEHGPIKSKGIAEVLGMEWLSTDGRKIIADELNTQERRGTLIRVSHGSYAVRLNVLAAKGVSRSDQLRQLLRRVVRENGGFARVADIMDWFGCRAKKDGADVYGVGAQWSGTYSTITKALRNASSIVRYYAGDDDERTRCIWGLPWDEVQTIPISGRWMYWILSTGIERSTSVKKDAELRLDQAMTAHSIAVGTAFQTLLHMTGTTAEQLVRIPEIERELIDMGYNLPVSIAAEYGAENEALRVYRAKGDAKNINAIAALKAELLENKALAVYLAFQNGARAPHLYSTVNLYKAVAKHFNVCPASLSRGSVVFPPLLESGEIYDATCEIDDREATSVELEELLAAFAEDQRLEEQAYERDLETGEKFLPSIPKAKSLSDAERMAQLEIYAEEAEAKQWDEDFEALLSEHFGYDDKPKSILDFRVG